MLFIVYWQSNQSIKLQLSKTVIVIIILVFIYVVFLVFSDVEKTLSTIISINLRYLLTAIGLWALGGMLRVFRWHFFLKRITSLIPFRQSILYFLSGYAFILSPARVGEIIRSPFIKRDYGISISKTAPIVLVERFYDLLAVTVIISVGLIFSDFEKTIIILPVAFVVLMLLIIRSKSTFSKILRKLSRMKLVSMMVPNIEESFEVIFSLIRIKYFLSGTITSITIGILEAASVYFLILGLNGGIDFNNLIVIFHASNFAAAASMIPGGIGIMEGGLVGLLVIYKVNYETALAVVVLVRLISTGMFSAIGIICLRLISKGKK